MAAELAQIQNRSVSLVARPNFAQSKSDGGSMEDEDVDKRAVTSLTYSRDAQ